MKFVKKLNLFSFLLGVILSGSAVYAATLLANNISYDNTNSGINANNVQDAIDTLYTKVNTSYDEYNGTTTYTPSTSIQTIPTNNKLMKSDITINAIPSNYKNLNTATTADASKILSGYTAYNNNGELITGNISTNCVSGKYSHLANSQFNMYIGFIPSKYMLTFDTGQGMNTVVYDSVENKIYITRYYNDTTGEWNWLSISNNSIISSFGTNTGVYKNSFDIYYMACK